MKAKAQLLAPAVGAVAFAMLVALAVNVTEVSPTVAALAVIAISLVGAFAAAHIAERG